MLPALEFISLIDIVCIESIIAISGLCTEIVSEAARASLVESSERFSVSTPSLCARSFI